jgi:hypothetical protein
MLENGETTGEKVGTKRSWLFRCMRESLNQPSTHIFLARPGTGSLFHTDGSEFRGNFRGDEKIAGVLHLPDGIMRREHYVNGELQS